MPRHYDYDKRTDTILDHCGGFTPCDFLRLAMACLDQAGLDLRGQRLVLTVLDREFTDVNPTTVASLMRRPATPSRV
jgi:hypothetical protein